MPEKVLIVGPVNGRLTELISKVSAIQSKHGPFAALFILGDLFHPSPSESALQQQINLFEGTLRLPIPAYFYQGSGPTPQSLAEKIAAASAQAQKDVPQGLVKLADNLFFATGKSGVFETSSGLRVAFVGGVWDPSKFAQDVEAEGAQFDPETWYESDLQRAHDEATAHITPATIHRLLAHTSFRLPFTSTPTTNGAPATASNAKPGTLAAARALASADQAKVAAQTAALDMLTSRPPIDLLLTNCWPTGITLFSTPSTPADPSGGLPDPTARMWGSPAIARLASHACPRYHFSLAPSPLPEDESNASLPVGIEQDTLDMGAFWERAPYTTNLSSYLSAQQQQQLQSTPAGRKRLEGLKAVTRFVSLAKFANEKKKRWFLALNLTPAKEQQQVMVPANATQTPYSVPSAHRGDGGGANGKRSQQDGGLDQAPNYRFQEPRNKRQRAEGGTSEDVPPPGYVCRICNVEGHYIRLCPLKQSSDPATTSSAPAPPTLPPQNSDPPKQRWSKSTMPLPPGLPSKPAFAQHAPRAGSARQMIPVGPSNCWFCLSNPAIAKQLIITISADSYLVFPKGPFVHPTINDVPHSAAHLLIVPLAHTSNLLPPTHPVLSSFSGEELDAEERERTRREMEETKMSLRELWGRKRHVMLEWTLVRVRTSSRMTHFQTQCLALLRGVVEDKGVVKALDDGLEAVAGGKEILRNADEVSSYFTRATAAGEEEAEEQDGYFHMVLHADSRKEWLVPLTTTSRFPVQFVRTTLANTLEVPELADWKAAEAQQRQVDQEEGLDEGEREKQRSAGFRALLLGS
ncbi:CWF19-like protein DRN1 [Pseudozyma hubeiensis]|nr:CWF19-like protein DRN1 [Pseudozyma hubeiensis]